MFSYSPKLHIPDYGNTPQTSLAGWTLSFRFLLYAPGNRQVEQPDHEKPLSVQRVVDAESIPNADDLEPRIFPVNVAAVGTVKRGGLLDGKASDGKRVTVGDGLREARLFLLLPSRFCPNRYRWYETIPS